MGTSRTMERLFNCSGGHSVKDKAAMGTSRPAVWRPLGARNGAALDLRGHSCVVNRMALVVIC